MKTIHIKQIDGGSRVVALSDADAAMVRRDPVMIDAVTPLGIMDIDRYGRRTLGAAGPYANEIPRAVRDVLGWRT